MSNQPKGADTPEPEDLLTRLDWYSRPGHMQNNKTPIKDAMREARAEIIRLRAGGGSTGTSEPALKALYGPRKSICWTPYDDRDAEEVVLISKADFDRVNRCFAAPEGAGTSERTELSEADKDALTGCAGPLPSVAPEPALELTKKERMELELRRDVMSRYPFCPDHRDKVRGLSCRQCEVERLTRRLERAESPLVFPDAGERGEPDVHLTERAGKKPEAAGKE